MRQICPHLEQGFFFMGVKGQNTKNGFKLIPIVKTNEGEKAQRIIKLIFSSQPQSLFEEALL